MVMLGCSCSAVQSQKLPAHHWCLQVLKPVCCEGQADEVAVSLQALQRLEATGSELKAQELFSPELYCLRLSVMALPQHGESIPNGV